MRYFQRLLALLALSMTAAAATAATLSDQLVADLLHKHLPAPLYERGNNSWPGGHYRLQVFKNGRPIITSRDKSIRVQVPLRIELAGNAANEMLGLKFTCDSSFLTLGEVVFTPLEDAKGTALQSEISLPIPPVMAQCDSVQLPIEGYLKAFVQQNKPIWEQQIDREVNGWLSP